MACTSNSMNFSNFTKSTKFKESQIKNFYLYFKKYAKETPNKLNYSEFKSSLGILGSKSNDFICIRLFDMLSDKKSQKLSFGSYLKFMNLVNYGTIEEKIAHSFKFFDLDGKGYISKTDFRKTILSLCEYFSSVSSSQMKIREEDIDIIFDDMLEKSESLKLNLEAFMKVSNSHPEILDFFDIFNNKILDNLTLIIHKDTLKKIENVILHLKILIDKTEKRNMRNLDLTLTIKSYIEKTIRDRKLLIKREQELQNRVSVLQRSSQVTHNYFLNQNQINNIQAKNQINKSLTSNESKTGDISFSRSYSGILPKAKMFLVSDQVKNKFSHEDPDSFELEVSDMEDDLSSIGNSFQEDEQKISKASITLDKSRINVIEEMHKMSEKKNANKNRSNVLPLEETKSNISPPSLVTVDFPDNDFKSFEIISKRKRSRKKTVDIHHDDFTLDSNVLRRVSVNPDDFEFFQPSDLNDIKDKDLLDQIMLHGIEINNCLIISNKTSFIKTLNKLKDALRDIVEEIDPSKKVVKRRQAFSLDMAKASPMEKEDFLNMPFHAQEEKGLIHFGNENVELVLNMMIGIRNSVNLIGGNRSLFPLETNDDAFKEINTFKYTHNTNEKEAQCIFHDYAPKIFYNIRKLYGINNESYIKSLGPENFLGNLILIKNRSLRELCSAGKSGSFFYYSYDSKFVLKTISVHEFEFFEQILQDYYNHIVKNPNSMLQRFFGMHTMYFNDIKMHFVIMNNVFNTNVQVHYKYDLKGSTYQRMSRSKKEKNYDNYDYAIPMKDLDFKERGEKIVLLKQERELISQELLNDSEFLASKNINDYSLLIGVHNPDCYNGNSNSKMNLMEQLGNFDNKYNQISIGNMRNINIEMNGDKEFRKPFYEKHRGGVMSSDGKKIYFFGIIDIFTQYG
jgi:Ca2+-binding EF-hand superfamily protein